MFEDEDSMIFEDQNSVMVDGSSGDWLINLGPIFMVVIGGIILLIVISALIKNISNWNMNNQQPELSVIAKVVGKRTSIRGGGETRAYNQYFVTFEVDSGDRMEFHVKGEEYGQLIEGDKGELLFQGTRFLGYTRKIDL